MIYDPQIAKKKNKTKGGGRGEKKTLSK